MRAASRRLNSERLTLRRGETLHRCRKYPPSSRAREIGRMRAASVECPIPCDGGWRERSAGVGALHDERFTSVLGSGEMSDVVGRQERGKVAEGGSRTWGLVLHPDESAALASKKHTAGQVGDDRRSGLLAHRATSCHFVRRAAIRFAGGWHRRSAQPHPRVQTGTTSILRHAARHAKGYRVGRATRRAVLR
jgi:hypothetical protein